MLRGCSRKMALLLLIMGVVGMVTQRCRVRLTWVRRCRLGLLQGLGKGLAGCDNCDSAQLRCCS